MSKTLTEKLMARRVKEETSQSSTNAAEIKKMTLLQLENETIQFGRAKLGLTFAEAFNDHKWTDWFVSQYENSNKTSHMKYIAYVEKRLDFEDQSSPKKERNKKMAPPVKSEASWSHVKEDAFSDVDSGEEMSQKISAQAKVNLMEDQVNALFEENRAIHSRMGNIEGALSELISHVKKMQTAEP